MTSSKILQAYWIITKIETPKNRKAHFCSFVMPTIKYIGEVNNKLWI